MFLSLMHVFIAVPSMQSFMACVPTRCSYNTDMPTSCCTCVRI